MSADADITDQESQLFRAIALLQLPKVFVSIGCRPTCSYFLARQMSV